MNISDRFKIRISYLFIFVAVTVYIISKSQTYEILIETADVKSKINEIEKQVDEITVKINTENSNDKVKDDYPDLDVENNVYYLENNEK